MSNVNSIAQKSPNSVTCPTKESSSEDDSPLNFRRVVQGFAIFSGFIAILFGFWSSFGVIALNYLGVISGVFLICVGILVIANETPFCCLYQSCNGQNENRNKAVGYCIAAIPAALLSPSLASVFASGLLFITGILYGTILFYQKQQKPHQQEVLANADKSSHKEIAVDPTYVLEMPANQPNENQEVAEDKNESKSPDDNVEHIYPNLSTNI